MKFKVYTEAEVTAVTKLALTQLSNVQLHPAHKSGPDRKPLKALVKYPPYLVIAESNIFVVEKLKHNLLRLPAIKDLNLLVMVDPMIQIIQRSLTNFQVCLQVWFIEW